MIRWNGLTVDARSGVVLYGGRAVRMRQSLARVCAYIVASPDAFVSVRALIDAMYSGRADGGPLWASRVVYMAVFELRLALQALGAPMVVETFYTTGYRLRLLDQASVRNAA